MSRSQSFHPPERPMSPTAEFAFRVLEAIAESGYVLAPAEPTEAMLAAAAAADIAPEKAAGLYRAMLAAA